MIQLAGTVTYHDGRTVVFAGGPREWVMWEQYALTHGLPTAAPDPAHAAALTMTWFLSWACATRGANPRPGFETWLDTIASVDDFTLEDADPFRPEPSDAASSDSPSPPGSAPPTSTPPIPATSQP